MKTCTLQLLITQPIRSRILRMQRSPNRRTVLKWNQGIGCSAQTHKFSPHLRQQLKGRSTPTRPHPTDASAVKIKRA